VANLFSRFMPPRARNGQAKGTQPSENLKSKIAAAPLAQLAEQLTLNQRLQVRFLHVARLLNFSRCSHRPVAGLSQRRIFGDGPQGRGYNAQIFFELSTEPLAI